MKKKLSEIIQQIPLGYSEAIYQGKKYGLTRSDFNSGNSTKVFAEELGGKDFISFNFYLIQSGELLNPCEMPKQKVLDFLMAFEIIGE